MKKLPLKVIALLGTIIVVVGCVLIGKLAEPKLVSIAFVGFTNAPLHGLSFQDPQSRFGVFDVRNRSDWSLGLVSPSVITAGNNRANTGTSVTNQTILLLPGSSTRAVLPLPYSGTPEKVETYLRLMCGGQLPVWYKNIAQNLNRIGMGGALNYFSRPRDPEWATRPVKVQFELSQFKP